MLENDVLIISDGNLQEGSFIQMPGGSYGPRMQVLNVKIKVSN